MACEHLLDEVIIKVMLEKDPVVWKSYSPLTDEERRMHNAMVSPPVNPHPFVSDMFEQAGVTHLSSTGGTPTLYYPASTTLPAVGGGDGGMPTPILSGGAGSPLGAAPLFADEGGPKKRMTRTVWTGRLTPRLGGMLPSPLNH
jgi:hypothetical protein